MSFINSISDWFRNSGQISNSASSFFYKVGEPFGYTSLSDQKAMEMFVSAAAIYSVVKTGSEGISSLPFVLAIEAEDGEREAVTSGEVYDFIFNPNQDQTLQELFELQSLYYLINGEFFNYEKIESIGFAGEVVSLPPETIKVLTDRENTLLSKVTGYKFTDGATTTTLDIEDVLHVKMTNPTMSGRKSRNGLSPLQSGFNIGNAAVNIETALSWYFENRGVSNIVSGTDNPAMSLTQDDQDLIRKAFNRKMGGAHRSNGLEVVQSPLTVTQLNASSTDMQTVENYNSIIERVCALYGLPAILVQVNENSTYNNVLEAKIQAYNEFFIPTAEKFLGGYDRKYLKAFSKRDGVKYVMYVDREKIGALMPNPIDKRRALIEEVKTGVITRNEYRVETNRDPLDDKNMDVATTQSNLIAVADIGGDSNE